MNESVKRNWKGCGFYIIEVSDRVEREEGTTTEGNRFVSYTGNKQFEDRVASGLFLSRTAAEKRLMELIREGYDSVPLKTKAYCIRIVRPDSVKRILTDIKKKREADAKTQAEASLSRP